MNNSLFDILLNSVKARFPKLNWKLGSVIRTLLLEPLVHVSGEVSDYIAKVVRDSDISTMLNNPYDYEEELNSWITKLNIVLPQPTASTGTLTLIKRTNEPLTIAAGTDFYWGENTHVYAVDRISYGGTGKPFTEVSPGVFSMEIPVQTSDRGVTFLSPGAAMNWDSAPDDVMDIYVQSAIGGGVVVDATLKAALVAARLTAPSLMGIDSIRATIVQQYNGAICDAMPGDKSIYGGLCTLPLYLKQNYPPTENSIDIPAKNINIVDNVIEVRIDTEGILALGDITTNNGIKLTPSKVQQFGELGSPASYCVIWITQFSDPKAVLANVTLTAKVLQFSGATAACQWLNSNQQALPYTIHGELPAYGAVKLQINTGGVTIPQSALTEICSFINNSALDSNITDIQIKGILADYGISVNSAILYIVHIHCEGHTVTTTQSGALSVYGLLGLGGTPCALYCSINDIASY